MSRTIYKYLISCSCIYCKKEISIQNLDRHIESKHKNNKLCKNCGKTILKKFKFCSQFCSAIFNQTGKQRNIKYNIIIQKPLYTKVSKCVICNKWFSYNKKKVKCCSSECLTLSRKLGGKVGGKISASLQIRRSKDEIELYNLCCNYFKNVTHNECLFNGWDADIIIHDIKLAILWNGSWHYKEMPGLKHSLKQVQNRDLIKINEIQNLNWKCFVFEDRYYTPEKAFNYIKNNF